MRHAVAAVLLGSAALACSSPPPAPVQPCALRDAGAHTGPSALEVIQGAIAQALAVERATHDHEPNTVVLPECSDDLCRLPDAGRQLETLERYP